MLKEAAEYGAEDALQYYGTEEAQKPSLLRKALPWLGAATAAGLTYKGLRTPSFSKNPGLRKLQQRAAEKGFHRVVEVPHLDPLEEGAGFVDKLTHGLAPHVNPETGDMNWWNRLKFRLLEGGEAIPVTTRGGKVWVPNSDRKPVNVSGVVHGRHMIPGTSEDLGGKAMSSVVRGGIDAEGPLATQQAVSRLGRKGKGVEADLLMKYAPESMPESWTNLHPHFEGLAAETPAQRIRSAKKLQARLREAHGSGGEFFLKPTQGLQSGGAFPRSDSDWSKDLAKFESLVANPKRLEEFNAHAESPGDLAGFLQHHDVLEGHTIHEALKDPSSVFAQRILPEPLGEWRVHTVGGAAPLHLMSPRHGDSVSVGRTIPAMLGVGDVKAKNIQSLVEDTLSKLPPEYQKGSYGMDVMPYRRPDGSVGIKILEMNPSERANLRTGEPGGGSGLIDTKTVPYAAHAHYRALTGRHTPLVAGLGAAGAAGLGAAAAQAAQGLAPDSDEPPANA